MENPVCALVEKQFVTTFPGAVELQLIGKLFTYAERAGRRWTWGLGVTSGCGGSPRWPLYARPCMAELPPSRPATSWGLARMHFILLGHYYPHGHGRRPGGLREEVTCLWPTGWERPRLPRQHANLTGTALCSRLRTNSPNGWVTGL